MTRAAEIFHLSPLDVWSRQASGHSYLPEQYAQDGFIHCTHGAERVVDVGNRYYRSDPRAYVALLIDHTRVSIPIIYEDDEQVFPHLYGALAVNAVVNVLPVVRDEAGNFLRLDQAVPGEDD